jgi:hypothetical protein
MGLSALLSCAEEGGDDAGLGAAVGAAGAAFWPQATAVTTSKQIAKCTGWRKGAPLNAAVY